MSIEKIVSGGQTGVDRAALDVAIHLDIPHGGWCPKGRRSEDGRIPDTYQLRETPSFNYKERTEANVVHSDGTLILCQGDLSRGTALTLKLARKYNRPFLVIDLDQIVSYTRSIDSVTEWVSRSNIQVLNVAGPRESSCPGITPLAEQFLVGVLTQATGNG